MGGWTLKRLKRQDTLFGAAGIPSSLEEDFEEAPLPSNHDSDFSCRVMTMLLV